MAYKPSICIYNLYSTLCVLITVTYMNLKVIMQCTTAHKHIMAWKPSIYNFTGAQSMSTVLQRYNNSTIECICDPQTTSRQGLTRVYRGKMTHVCIWGYIGHTRSKYGGYSRAYKHLKWGHLSQQQQFVNDVVVQVAMREG